MTNLNFGTGCLVDPRDDRDLIADEILTGMVEIDWEKGYDVEKDLKITIPLKNQGKSGSCVGQGWSYYVGVLNSFEVGKYDEISAKAIYSLIQLGFSGGGAYIRDGAKLIIDWGSLFEKILSSYDNGKPPTEEFMRDKSWKTPEMDKLAKVLQSKEYRLITAETNMDLFAKSIRDNYGVVSGLNGENNESWLTNEPKPPVKKKWGHCIYFGKFGIDEKGKYISTPNSWGERKKDDLHYDGWQKIREDYFKSGNMYNPWTLIDKSNIMTLAKVLKVGDAIYIAEEQTNEAALYANLKNHGLECPSDNPNTVRFDDLKIDGEIIWNKK